MTFAGFQVLSFIDLFAYNEEMKEGIENEVLHSIKKGIPFIVEQIELINSKQNAKNEDIFGYVENNATLSVIVIQVHNRIQYLRQLIFSLSQVSRIGLMNSLRLKLQTYVKKVNTISLSYLFSGPKH